MSDLIRLSDTCVFDLDTQTVMRRGKQYRLTDVQYRLLELLVANRGTVLSTDMLIQYVWGNSYTGTRQNLAVMISRIRNKIENDHSSPTVLLTMHRSGYVLSLYTPQS